MDLSRVAWRKGSRSGGNGGACVEVAEAQALRLARDSKNPGGPVLSFTLAEWRRFTADVKAGAFDL